MSIRTKIGLILLCAVIGFCIAQYCVQRFIILPGFLSLEHHEAVKDTNRVKNAIKNEINHLNTLCRDWAAWDNTYAFVKSKSSEYIESNLVLTSFTTNNLNLIYICDTNGHVVWGKIYDLKNEKFITLKMFPADTLPAAHPLLTRISDQSLLFPEIKGVLTTEAEPMLVAALPILTSRDTGPSLGTFILGRFINENMAKKIAAQTQVDFHINSFTLDTYPDILTHLNTNKENPFIKVIDRNHLEVIALFSDITGKQPLIIQTTFHREISNKGYETIHHGIYSTLIVGLSILLMVLLSLKKTIINPITKFTNHVLLIEKTGDFSKHFITRKKDEIGILSQACNKMTQRIEQSTNALSDANKQLKEDINKRKQVESALRESENRFRSMIEQAGDAVFLHDLNGHFRIVNQVACDRLGYEMDELLTLSAKDISSTIMEWQDIKTFWKNLDQKLPSLLESEHRRKDGSFFPVEVSLNPIQYGGEKMILVIARNIAERKQLEDRVRHSQKMEALSTLTAGLSHNFNNVLSIIIGCTELAIKKISKDNNVYGLLKKIEDASIRAKDIVWQLINFSQRFETDIKPIQIKPVVQKEISRLESYKHDNIDLKTYIQTDCHSILGNTSQIEQMLTNLINNALESMKDEGGKLDLRIENIMIDEDARQNNMDLTAGQYVKISVKDTGHGIDPAHMDRIFDPYFSTKNFADGAGMGLSIVYGIVKSNGGSITIESESGNGTQVVILFPAKEPVT